MSFYSKMFLKNDATLNWETHFKLWLWLWSLVLASGQMSHKLERMYWALLRRFPHYPPLLYKVRGQGQLQKTWTPSAGLSQPKEPDCSHLGSGATSQVCGWGLDSDDIRLRSLSAVYLEFISISCDIVLLFQAMELAIVYLIILTCCFNKLSCALLFYVQFYENIFKTSSLLELVISHRISLIQLLVNDWAVFFFVCLFLASS